MYKHRTEDDSGYYVKFTPSLSFNQVTTELYPEQTTASVISSLLDTEPTTLSILEKPRHLVMLGSSCLPVSSSLRLLMSGTGVDLLLRKMTKPHSVVRFDISLFGRYLSFKQRPPNHCQTSNFSGRAPFDFSNCQTSNFRMAKWQSSIQLLVSSLVLKWVRSRSMDSTWTPMATYPSPISWELLEDYMLHALQNANQYTIRPCVGKTDATYENLQVLNLGQCTGMSLAAHLHGICSCRT